MRTPLSPIFLYHAASKEPFLARFQVLLNPGLPGRHVSQETQHPILLERGTGTRRLATLPDRSRLWYLCDPSVELAQVPILSHLGQCPRTVPSTTTLDPSLSLPRIRLPGTSHRHPLFQNLPAYAGSCWLYDDIAQLLKITPQTEYCQSFI